MAKKKENEKNQGKKEIIRGIPETKEKPAPAHSKEEQAKTYDRILKTMFIIIGIIVLGVILFVAISNSLSRFEYRGVKFEITRFCDAGPPCLVLYRTSLPVEVSGKNIILSLPENKTNDYNFYLRKDPRKLDVPFNGSIEFKSFMVLNSESDFKCNGNGAIAAANLNMLYQILDFRVIKDQNASCDLLGRYMLINVKPGNITSVEQIGPSCYNINIKDCEILEGTERFMIETFVKVNEVLANSTNS